MYLRRLFVIIISYTLFAASMQAEEAVGVSGTLLGQYPDEQTALSTLPPGLYIINHRKIHLP